MLWKNNYDKLCKLFLEYDADDKCKDLTRLFRLMGSKNYKDNTEYNTGIVETRYYPGTKTFVDNNYFDIPCFDKEIKLSPKKKKKKIVEANDTTTVSNIPLAKPIVTTPEEMLKMEPSFRFNKQNKTS